MQSKLTEQEARFVAALPERNRMACTNLLEDLRVGAIRIGLQYQLIEIKTTPSGFVVMVYPATMCSLPRFAATIRKAISGWPVKVWDHVPGRIECAIEFVDERSNEQSPEWERFKERQAWRAAVADNDQLPIPLGVDVMGEDVVIDLAKLSGLVIWGGDTLDQTCLLEGMLGPLFSSRKRSLLQLYYLCSRWIPLPEQCVSDVDKVSDANWSEKVIQVCTHVKEEIKIRDRLFRALGCESIAEYNAKSMTRIPHVIVAIIDPPSSYDGGEEPKERIEAAESAVYDLISDCDARFGVHALLVDFIQSRFQTDFDGMFGQESASRCSSFGCLVHHNHVCHYDAAKASRIFGSPDAAMILHDSLLYRSEFNEVYKIRALATLLNR